MNQEDIDSSSIATKLLQLISFSNSVPIFPELTSMPIYLQNSGLHSSHWKIRRIEQQINKFKKDQVSHLY